MNNKTKNENAINTVAAALAVLLGLSAAASRVPEHPGTNTDFERLKSLAGNWEGTNPEGKQVTLSYEVVSNGSSLLERLHPSEEAEMVTLYSPDGDRVSVTHYCNAGNQPQMQTAPISTPIQKIAFTLVRVTNLSSPVAGHMVALTLTIPDGDHLTQEWTWSEGGKTKTEVLHFLRKR